MFIANLSTGPLRSDDLELFFHTALDGSCSRFYGVDLCSGVDESYLLCYGPTAQNQRQWRNGTLLRTVHQRF